MRPTWSSRPTSPWWRAACSTSWAWPRAPSPTRVASWPRRRRRAGTRPGVKIQDGCDNRCTYCIVWKARGRGRSLSPDEVLAGIRAAQARGAHEVVLTGINLGSYRWERDGAPVLRLPGLLDLIMEKTDVERVRLSSIEPPDVTPELCDAMARGGERVAPFLHVCLQSGSDRTLRRMARVYRTDLFRRAVEEARSLVPRLAPGHRPHRGLSGRDGRGLCRLPGLLRGDALCQDARLPVLPPSRDARRGLPRPG